MFCCSTRTGTAASCEEKTLLSRQQSRSALLRARVRSHCAALSLRDKEQLLLQTLVMKANDY